MSLRKNILASYVSQIYVTLTGIVILPLYIQCMGAEAYGLVGFFAMLQVWFNMLDMGLSATVARESARYRGGALDKLSYRRLIWTLEAIFLVVAVLGGGLLFLAAEWTATRWLNASKLPLDQIASAIRLMAIIVALRWFCGLYRGVITGAENLVWLGGFSAFIATLRYIGVLLVLVFISATPVAFFVYQLAVAVVETAGTALYAIRLLPKLPNEQRAPWSWTPIKPMLKFSVSIAFTSSVWVLVTQTDKLVLSRILTLSDYGYFSVAVLAASGIGIISGPISSAILPRMSNLQAQSNHDELIKVYRQATRLMANIALPAALVLIFFSHQVLWAWTGNAELTDKAATTLALYAAGYGFLAVAAFPYYLQYAKGNLRLHVIGNIGFVGVLVPAIVWATNRYGMVGAGWVWLLSNGIFFLGWTPIVHHKFAPDLHRAWMLGDIVRPTLFTTAGAWLIFECMTWADDRIALAAELVGAGCALLAVAYLSSSGLKIKSSNKSSN